ncbi:MAG: hypothetical protein N2202_09670, partial [Proteobacteria bacterium]|nr:hypothetical protein [Pseudomonadota bacterium]
MKKNSLIFALFLLAFGGLILHLRIHPVFIKNPLVPDEKVFDFTHFFGSLLSSIDLIIVTLLFLSKRTAVYGYLLNGLIVIYGVILMAHFSISDLIGKEITLQILLFKTTLPHICIAWADFFIGNALF